MKNLISELKQLKNSLHMSSTEHDALRESLDEYMSLNPVRTPTTKHKRNIYGGLLHMLNNKFAPALLMVALLASSGVGVAYASEQALPDEPLYTIKEIIEETHAKILITDEAKASWAEQRVQRRLDEARRMLRLGRLTDEQSTRIEMRKEHHKKRAEEFIGRFEGHAPKKARHMRSLLKDNGISIKELQKSMAHNDSGYMMRLIEAEYRKGEQQLLELEKSLQELDDIIPTLE